jgi:hypothetical protein
VDLKGQHVIKMIYPRICVVLPLTDRDIVPDSEYAKTLFTGTSLSATTIGTIFIFKNIGRFYGMFWFERSLPPRSISSEVEKVYGA